jgi:hypothetical protein
MSHFSHCYNPSPFQAHWGRWHHTHLLQPASLFTVLWGSALPPLQWHVPHFSCFYKLSRLQVCWAGATMSAFYGQLVYLQLVWGSAPSPLSRAQGTPPSLLLFFFSSCLFIIQFDFFLFSLGVGHSVQGLCWFVPGLSVGVPHAT